MLPRLCALVVFFGVVTCKTCPDRTPCQKDSTCCKLKGGKYTCCPLPNAVCCPDKEHCCPQGYSCDNETDACKPSASSVQPLLQAFAKTRTKENYVTCGKGEYLCPDDFTCCKSGFGVYNCCPLPNAVCCYDGQHCCPSGTSCDLSRSQCTLNAQVRPKVKVFLLKPARLLSNMTHGLIVCPDDKMRCDDTETCCLMAKSTYGCCPLPNATCCKDLRHCCAHDMVCGEGGICTRWSNPFAKATLAKAVAGRTTKIVCPDGKFKCPDGYTCCKAPDSSWSCCPLKNAVCCDDHIHCCPEGSVCNTSRGKCQSKANGSLPWSLKVKAIPVL
uniref:Putative low-density lipoprotein receptor n=1 Tax=Ixodes ricinus TaxID=34613 RepID=A0A6B0V976_IXORI